MLVIGCLAFSDDDSIEQGNVRGDQHDLDEREKRHASTNEGAWCAVPFVTICAQGP